MSLQTLTLSISISNLSSILWIARFSESSLLMKYSSITPKRLATTMRSARQNILKGC